MPHRNVNLGLAISALLLSAAVVQAQPPVHYFQNIHQRPGAIGNAQLMRHPRMVGYVQPVQIRAPKGVKVSFAENGRFGSFEATPAKVGMMIGRVYRFKVTDIPFHEGEELFPSVELINRLHPPAGRELQFPIPIELTAEELDFALDGRFVTRVIYLEEPNLAVPHLEDPQRQLFLEVGPREDPLKVADELGRPMAILRIGSRIPLQDNLGRFAFDMPPLRRYPNAPAADPPADPATAAHRRGLERSLPAVPRIALPGDPWYVPPQVARPRTPTRR
ncbi:MAG: hypothetical protein QGG36_31500 [Pirellulaceae bacterium]|nr:hypothetical protein [Pirellulaceae bacterium]MDP7020366.1 hypothetical protein [Pirellulaceae bacterium]